MFLSALYTQWLSRESHLFLLLQEDKKNTGLNMHRERGSRMLVHNSELRVCSVIHESSIFMAAVGPQNTRAVGETHNFFRAARGLWNGGDLPGSPFSNKDDRWSW